MLAFLAWSNVVRATLAAVASSEPALPRIASPTSIRGGWRLLACMLTTCVLAPSAGEAALLSVTPSSSTVNVGDTVAIEVVVEDVADLGYIEFALDFDATLLSPDPATLAVGDFLTAAGGFVPRPPYDPSFDLDTILFRVLLNGASTAASVPRTVLSLSFVALAPGTSSLTLADAMLLDTGNRSAYMIGERFDRMAVERNNGSVDVVTPAAVVPEPTTIVLTITGLATGWWKRRRPRA
jgi:hypothetical protein